MNRKKLIVTLTCLSLAIPITAGAGPLEKRHLLGLRVGMWNQVTNVRTEVSVDQVYTSVGTGGAMGGIYYGHGLSENLTLNISIGGMATNIESRVGLFGESTETGSVGFILMGVKQYFPRSTFDRAVRPFAKAYTGLFIGSQVRTQVSWDLVVESRSEPAIGGQLGAGVDFILGRHFLTGVALGYNLMTDFNEPIGGSKNYSGPEFSLEFAYLFGKGTD